MSWTQYLGKNVLGRSAVQTNRPAQQYEAVTIGRDFQSRKRYTLKPPGTAITREFLLPQHSDMLDLRRFWRAHKGMLSAFWLPTFARDYPLTQGETAGTSSLRIGKHDYHLLDGRTRHIMIPRIDCRARIVSITDQGTYFSAALSVATPADVLVDDVVCGLLYVRFSSDSFPLENVKSAGIWSVTLGFEELPMEVPIT